MTMSDLLQPENMTAFTVAIVGAAAALGALAMKGWDRFRTIRKERRADENEVVAERLEFRHRMIKDLERHFEEQMAAERKRCDEEIKAITDRFHNQIVSLEARIATLEAQRSSTEAQLNQALARIAELNKQIAGL